MRLSANPAADQRRQQQAARRQWLWAAALTLLGHTALLLFRPALTNATPPLGSAMRRTRMLPLDDPAPAQSAIHHWYRWYNPLHFAKPTALTFAAPMRRPPTPNLPFTADRPPQTISIGEFSPLPVPTLPAELRLAAAWPEPVAMPTPTAESTLPEANFPCWRTRDGRHLPQLFPDPAALRRQAAAAGVTQPTTIELRHVGRRGGLFRISLLTSCGDAALDRTAVSALRLAAPSLFSGDAQSPDQCYIDLFWQLPQPAAAAPP